MSTLNLSNVENRTIVEPERVLSFGRFWPKQTGWAQTCLSFLNLADRYRQVRQVFLESSFARARIREVYVSTCLSCLVRFNGFRNQVQKWQTGWSSNLSVNLSEPVCKSGCRSGCSSG